APPAMHGDERSFREEGRAGLRLEILREAGPVDRRHVTVEPGLRRVPHSPGRVLHPVLLGPAVALDRVAPVVLGDEGGLGGWIGQGRLSSGRYLEPMPPTADAPGVGCRTG